jgi:hypothetical protein
MFWCWRGGCRADGIYVTEAQGKSLKLFGFFEKWKLHEEDDAMSMCDPVVCAIYVALRPLVCNNPYPATQSKSGFTWSPLQVQLNHLININGGQPLCLASCESGWETSFTTTTYSQHPYCYCLGSGYRGASFLDVLRCCL